MNKRSKSVQSLLQFHTQADLAADQWLNIFITVEREPCNSRLLADISLLMSKVFTGLDVNIFHDPEAQRQRPSVQQITDCHMETVNPFHLSLGRWRFKTELRKNLSIQKLLSIWIMKSFQFINCESRSRNFLKSPLVTWQLL